MNTADSRLEEPLSAESYGCSMSCCHCLSVPSIRHIILYSITVLQMDLTPTGFPEQGLSDRTGWCGRAGSP